MSSVENARRQWDEGFRRFQEEARDPSRAAALNAQVEAVTDELRRRVGQTFTLDDLAREYERADRWSRDAIAESELDPDPAAGSATAGDAAFHIYARGARDYEP